MNKMVAARLIRGHMKITEKTEMERMIKMGFVSAGLKILKVKCFARGPAISMSKMIAMGPIIKSSLNAPKKTALERFPMARLML